MLTLYRDRVCNFYFYLNKKKKEKKKEILLLNRKLDFNGEDRFRLILTYCGVESKGFVTVK